MMRSRGGGASLDSALPKTEDIVSRLMERLENPAGGISACTEPGKVYAQQYGTIYYRAMSVLYQNCEAPSTRGGYAGNNIFARQYHLRESFYALMDSVDKLNPRLAQGKKIVKQLYTQSTSPSPILDQKPSNRKVSQIEAWIRGDLVPAILGIVEPQQHPTLATAERGLSGSSASSPNEEISQVIDKWKHFLENPSNGLPICEQTSTEYHKQFGPDLLPSLAALINLCLPHSTSDISEQRRVLKESFLALSKTKDSALSDTYVKQGISIVNELLPLIRSSRYGSKIESDVSDGPFKVLSKFVDILLPAKGNLSPSPTVVSESSSSIVPSEREKFSTLSNSEIPVNGNQNVSPQSNQVRGSPPSSNWFQHGSMPGPSGIQQEQVFRPHMPQASTLSNAITSQNQPASTVVAGLRTTISRFLWFAAGQALNLEKHVEAGGQAKWEKLVNLRVPGEVKVEISNVGINLFLQFGPPSSSRLDFIPGFPYFRTQVNTMPLSHVLKFISEVAQRMETTGFQGTMDTFIPLQVSGKAVIQSSGPTQYKLVYMVESNSSTGRPVLQQNSGPSNINELKQVNIGNDLQSGGLYHTPSTQVQGARSGVTRNNNLEMFNGRPVALERPSKRLKIQHSAASDQDQSLQNTSRGTTSTQDNNKQGK